ncbi:hypothetical protein PDE_01732 [Penicillium oxalicum 114-2]|uniref:Uncharacterized protein n=1 Tax=Penicillium oxalicum (strain 114-2 / CGMCC 5302) TaxID=933388 RepID=S8ALQ5_PENO1|nr:hypothetical protein PDE_01732 [Penicillium oxalicum 114-2]
MAGSRPPPIAVRFGYGSWLQLRRSAASSYPLTLSSIFAWSVTLKTPKTGICERYSADDPNKANLPNLRRLFVEARTEVEENEYSRTAFYNLVLFISSVAIFSLAAQRMSGPKAAR